ncbi:LuxR family transcriptional regulator [Shimia litoralis]|uniref:LuxR family transcriptional regulator n=1 Tax=Shimia litoralis TaxID=420403 RepID=A0A4U7MWH4_9RHOB|nr:LuxR family transcriptional regulator [Shimia litoralis]TKZ17485.1 LuxR family transcriptional regulator [Shimia litoralis]
MNLDYIEAITNATSLEQLWEMHTAKMATYGFDRLIYGFTNFRTDASLGDVDDFMVLSNHDRDYLQKFLGEGLYFHGPMMRWSLENTGACSWTWVHDQAQKGLLTADEISVFSANAEMDVTAGYTISFPTISSRNKGAIAMTAERGVSQDEVDHIWQQSGRFIELANNIAHLKILSLPYSYPKRELTARQREVLEWVGDGKTIQDIATLIGRTPATVEKHLRLAREALNVETTAQALLKASFLRQIYKPDA